MNLLKIAKLTIWLILALPAVACAADGEVVEVTRQAQETAVSATPVYLTPSPQPPTRTPEPMEHEPIELETPTPAAPTPERVTQAVITWSHTDESGQCLQARIGREFLETGLCNESPTIYPLPEPRQAELARFLNTFYAFATGTPAGHIDFNGTPGGQNAVPFPEQERMVATWTWVVAEEARTGDEPDWNLALSWQRRQDGRCQQLRVFLTGFAEALACDGGELVELGWQLLERDKLARLYAWYDTFQATRAAQFELNGRGASDPGVDDQHTIDRYAEGLFAALATTAPGAAGEPVAPFATAGHINFAGWSPDGRWLAYWLSSHEDLNNQEPYAMPAGTLHFANVETGESCALPHFHTGADRSASVRWLNEDEVLVIMDAETWRGIPCQSDSFAPEANIPGEDEALDPALSPDGRFRAHSQETLEDNGTLSVVTTITDVETGSTLQTVEWQHRGGLGQLGLGGQWVSAQQFLIRETLDEGPLLIDVERAAVTNVLTELFTLEEIPSIHEEAEYGLWATAAPGFERNTFHLLVSGVGIESNFLPAMLYHAENSAVETLPYTHPWASGFSAGYEWLLFQEDVVTAGSDGAWRYTGYHIWGRRLEDVNGEWQLIAPAVDYTLWRDDESELAFIQNESTIIWQTFPEGQPIGHWHTGPYWVYPVAFSPDGRYLTVLGNVPGQQHAGLFLIAR